MVSFVFQVTSNNYYCENSCHGVYFNDRHIVIEPKGYPILLEHNDRIYRILDANCNRLREALRVIEEYFRFVENDKGLAVVLKRLRHVLVEIEDGIGRKKLLGGRNTEDDCFANKNRPEELGRGSVNDVLCANFKRAQEASRVIEEYAKIIPCPNEKHALDRKNDQKRPEKAVDTESQVSESLSEKAKTIRFTLYSLEKQFLDG